jgi:hypothetical protein
MKFKTIKEEEIYNYLKENLHTDYEILYRYWDYELPNGKVHSTFSISHKENKEVHFFVEYMDKRTKKRCCELYDILSHFNGVFILFDTNPNSFYWITSTLNNPEFMQWLTLNKPLDELKEEEMDDDGKRYPIIMIIEGQNDVYRDAIINHAPKNMNWDAFTDISNNAFAGPETPYVYITNINGK